MLTDATAQNIRRKAGIIDAVQLKDGKPLFSWIELSITELCNRACPFCPRVDADVYPNQNLHMSLGLATKMADELAGLEWNGRIILCGYSEPLLHPKIKDLVQVFASRDIRVEIVTNGDRLTPALVDELYYAGAAYMVVSMYDGPHQIAALTDIFDASHAPKDFYILRDRWQKEDEDFGLKLTNRAGTVSIGKQARVDVTHPCFYTAYQMMVDWNGDVLLCPQDWWKRVKIANLASTSIMEAWRSPTLHKRRMQLINGLRASAPCNSCNAEGTVHGLDHAKAWGKKQFA